MASDTGIRWRLEPQQGAIAVRLGRLIVVMILVCVTAGCSPVYVMRAAYEQSKILLARRPIEEVMNDPATPEADREKLALVLEARRFASEMGLAPGQSFTQYADIGKDTLAWVVMASRKDSFELYTWWFPIVGTVPYKGFFEQHDARDQAQSLEDQGYESSVRETEAFSTLGWFNDPLLSTTLKNSATRIVNTVLHESVHSTVWIPDHVPFNESLANFVGSRAAVDFFRARVKLGIHEAAGAQALADGADRADREHRSTMDFADCAGVAYELLSALYGRSNLTSEQKIAERQGVFDRAMSPCRERYHSPTSRRSLNNAELLQSTIYLTKLRLFERVHASVGGAWTQFFARIVEVRRRLQQRGAGDPFDVLQEVAQAHSDRVVAGSSVIASRD